MQYCQNLEQRLWFWVSQIQQHLFLPHFLFSSPTSCFPLIFPSSDHMHTHLIKSLYLPWQLCRVSSFHLFMLLLFHLLCSHDSSSSQLELIFVSSILNTQTYKTPFSHSYLSSYSYLPFNCEHHEGSDELVKWSFSTVDHLSPLPRFLVLSSSPDAGMRAHHLHSL